MPTRATGSRTSAGVRSTCLDLRASRLFCLLTTLRAFSGGSSLSPLSRNDEKSQEAPVEGVASGRVEGLEVASTSLELGLSSPGHGWTLPPPPTLDSYRNQSSPEDNTLTHSTPHHHQATVRAAAQKQRQSNEKAPQPSLPSALPRVFQARGARQWALRPCAIRIRGRGPSRRKPSGLAARSSSRRASCMSAPST